MPKEAYVRHIAQPLHNISPRHLFQMLSEEQVRMQRQGHALSLVVEVPVPRYDNVNLEIALEPCLQPRVGFVYDERMLLHKNEPIFIYEEVLQERRQKQLLARQLAEAQHSGALFSLQNAQQDDEDDDDEDFNPDASPPQSPSPHDGQADVYPPQYTDDDDDTDAFSQKSEDSFHPERPERLPAVIRMMDQEGLLHKCTRVDCRDATFDELALVHSPEHIRGVLEYVSSQGKVPLKYDKGDVYLNEHSGAAASLACGSVVELTDRVLSGDIDQGVAVVRSPGHHAERDRATGFCFFSNVAIAAKAMKKKHGIKRILIVDWDVHHGNGTQHALEDDPDILFFSVHRSPPFYPGNTGFADEIGINQGKGYTINVPFYEPYGDADILAAFHSVLLPVAYSFNPELVIVSAGFDAVKGDPIGRCNVTPSTYGQLTAMLKPLAAGKMVLALEGGYNLDQTARSFTECLRVLHGEEVVHNPILGNPSAMCRAVLQRVRLLHALYWPQCFPFEASVVQESEIQEADSAASTGEKRPRSATCEGDELSSDAMPRKKKRRSSESDLDDMSGEALFRMGKHYSDAGEYETAFLIFQKAKEKNSLDALFHLGDLYYSGKGVGQNLQEARIMYETGAQLGHAGCKCALAAMYAQHEISCPSEEQRQKMVLQWYSSAAYEDQHPIAYRNLGLCYKNAIGVPRDLSKCLECFLKAADLGNSQAMVSVGCMYIEEGKYGLARKYFEMAADNEDSNGYYNLGLMYEYGYGCSRSESRAVECFSAALSVDDSHEAAREKLGRLTAVGNPGH